MAGSARAADLGHAVRPRTDDEARIKSSSPGRVDLYNPQPPRRAVAMWGTIGSRALRDVLLGERLDAPPFQQTREVLPRRGHASSTFTASACPGSNDGDQVPSHGPPRNHCFCRGNSARAHDSHPLGAGMEPSAYARQPTRLSTGRDRAYRRARDALEPHSARRRSSRTRSSASVCGDRSTPCPHTGTARRPAAYLRKRRM
jgi:hypothetical protein